MNVDRTPPWPSLGMGFGERATTSLEVNGGGPHACTGLRSTPLAGFLQRIWIPALGLTLCACTSGSTPSELKLQQFRVTLGATGFTVRGPDAGVLLESANLTGGYASMATRQVKARYESQFGSYRITEGLADWSAAQKFEWAGATATVRDASGTQIATLELTAPSDGVLKLTSHATNPAANRLSLSFKCNVDDHFLGFGAQADALDHRGHTVPIFTSEPGIGKSDSDGPPDLWFLVGARHASSYGLPSFLSNRGFLAVLEHDGRSVFEICSVKTEAFRVEAWSNTWTLWLYFGVVIALAIAFPNLLKH